MPKGTCSIEDCDRPAYGHGWCYMHWKRWRKHGDPTHVRAKGRTPCVIDGCDSPNVGRGWCLKHYSRWRRHGSPTARMPGEVVDGKKICPQCCEDKALDQYSRVGDSWCRQCTTRHRNEYRWANPPPRVATEPRRCDACGEEFPANKRRNRYCSRECFQAFKHKANRVHVVARRARERDALVEEFDRSEIFERDGWICGVCQGSLDRMATWPDPQSPSIDHIVPIARGGKHERANVQAAHLGCNVRKGVTVA